jgi:hypothetical protein
MDPNDLPDASVVDRPTGLTGYDCVAAIAAVLWNETTETSAFATAAQVASRFNLAPNNKRWGSTPRSAISYALEVIQTFTGLTANRAAVLPTTPGAKDGSYAVFCLSPSKGHVIYGCRGPSGGYLFDPNRRANHGVVTDVTLRSLGFTSFESYLFTKAA